MSVLLSLLPPLSECGEADEKSTLLYDAAGGYDKREAPSLDYDVIHPSG